MLVFDLGKINARMELLKTWKNNSVTLAMQMIFCRKLLSKFNFGVWGQLKLYVRTTFIHPASPALVQSFLCNLKVYNLSVGAFFLFKLLHAISFLFCFFTF